MALNVRVMNKRHNPEVEEFVRNRLDSMVGRFAQRLSTLDVHLRDENAACEKFMEKRARM